MHVERGKAKSYILIAVFIGDAVNRKNDTNFEDRLGERRALSGCLRPHVPRRQ